MPFAYGMPRLTNILAQKIYIRNTGIVERMGLSGSYQGIAIRRFPHIAYFNATIALPKAVWIAWKGAMVVGKSAANNVLHPLPFRTIHAVITVNFQSSKSNLYQQ